MAHRMVRRSNGRLRKLSVDAQRKKEAAAEKQMQALELRKAGATYAEIAQALGYANAGGAKKAVDAMMKRTVFDLAEDIVTLDLQRLDEFQKRCMHQLRTKNDLSQIDRLMRIMERRYTLAGVAPETVKKIQEAYGLDGAVINNAGVMVVQVGHNSEQDFVKKMMVAAGVDPQSEEAQYYLDRVGKGRTVEPLRELTTGEDTSLGKSRRKKKKIVKKKTKAREEVPIEGVHIGGSNKGGHIPHPVVPPTHKELAEEEIIDAEIVDEGSYG